MITVKEYQKLTKEKKELYSPVYQKTMLGDFKLYGYIKIFREENKK